MSLEAQNLQREFVNLGVTIKPVGEGTGCPPWCSVMPRHYKKHCHGPEYRTKVTRGDAEVEVTTWGSESQSVLGPVAFDLLFDLWWGDYITREYPTLEEFLEFHTEYEGDAEAGKAEFEHQKRLSEAFGKLFPTLDDKMLVAQLVGLKGHLLGYRKVLTEATP